MAPADFRGYQRAFTLHVRDPRAHPRPAGVSARRMNIYNELMFNNVRGFLDACFPVSRELLGEIRWTRIARRFFAEHRCTTPLFRQIPEEFVRWMATRPASVKMPDFLPHLLHYEWVELALDVNPKETLVPGTDAAGDLLSGRPVLNPVSLLLEYPYAVHKIGSGYRPRPAQQEATFILAFRNHDDRVRFIVLNPVSARLVALLRDTRLTGRGALRRMAREMNHPDPAVVVAGGAQILENLRREEAVIGAAPSRR